MYSEIELVSVLSLILLPKFRNTMPNFHSKIKHLVGMIYGFENLTARCSQNHAGYNFSSLRMLLSRTNPFWLRASVAMPFSWQKKIGQPSRKHSYLLSIPGMRASIKAGLETPIEECSEELDWW